MGDNSRMFHHGYFLYNNSQVRNTQQGPRVWAYIRRLTTFTREDLFSYCFEIETLTIWQLSSNFIHVCFLQTQGTIHVRTQWYVTSVGDWDHSLTFVRGDQVDWHPFFLILLLYFCLTLIKILTLRLDIDLKHRSQFCIWIYVCMHEWVCRVCVNEIGCSVTRMCKNESMYWCV